MGEIDFQKDEWEASKSTEDRLFLELCLADCSEQLTLKHEKKAQEIIQLTKKKSWYEGGWE